MIVTMDERIASVIRALTDVILPSLPADAGLAQEQVQLSIGQLQIIRGELDRAPAFEAEELADAVSLGERLLARSSDAEALREALTRAGEATNPAAIRAARVNIHAATARLIAEGDGPALLQTIIAAERGRVVKDRAWFAPFGFDIAPPNL